MSLLVVAVKLLFPFDGSQRHPRSIHEPATQMVDWKIWGRHQQDFAKHPEGGFLARGSEIEVHDTDVFKMSQQELDSYMTWYQKTWVREPRPGSEGSVNKEILDMFPLDRLDTSVERTSMQREQELEKAVFQKAQNTTSSMKFQRPLTDEEASDQQPSVKRPGEGYRLYRSDEELYESEKAFFHAAAETACTSVQNLMLAVVQTETRITTWKRAKRRAEITGQDFDLDAEMGRNRDDGQATLLPQEMEAVNIGDLVRSEEGGGEYSDVDMEMMT